MLVLKGYESSENLQFVRKMVSVPTQVDAMMEK
jgi:hypothetical protein